MRERGGRKRGNNNLTKKNQRFLDDVDYLDETSRGRSISILVTGSVVGLTATPAYTLTKNISSIDTTKCIVFSTTVQSSCYVRLQWQTGNIDRPTLRCRRVIVRNYVTDTTRKR